MVPTPRTPLWSSSLLLLRRHLVRRMYLCRTHASSPFLRWSLESGSAQDYVLGYGESDGGRMACESPSLACPESKARREVASSSTFVFSFVRPTRTSKPSPTTSNLTLSLANHGISTSQLLPRTLSPCSRASSRTTRTKGFRRRRWVRASLPPSSFISTRFVSNTKPTLPLSLPPSPSFLHQALLNPYFHTSPYPTHPSKLPLPTPGTGVARILAPELNGQGQKHVLKDKKRKKGVDEDDEEDGEGSGTKKVARKLTFG